MNEERSAQEIINEVTEEQDKKFSPEQVKALEEKIYKEIEKETKEIVSKLELK